VKVVRGQIEKTAGIRKWLDQPTESMHPSVQPNNTTSQPDYTQSSASFSPFQTSEEDNKKAAAAAVAAKLAASASSAQMLASVFSSLVAEEAASMNSSLNSKGFTSGLPILNPEKRPRIEKSSPVSDVSSSDMASSSFFTTLQQPSLTNPQFVPSANMQTMSQANQLQAAFASAPLPPQYVQSTGFMDGTIPYGYVSNNLPPPPHFPPHAAPSSQPAQQQQQSSPGGFYRPPGIGFYGQSHPSTPPPPVHRQ
jgi:regulator of Ty1 transposition protein 103